ncbi:MAG: ThuA domain-containing protein [Verrucomicrobiota bacterium]
MKLPFRLAILFSSFTLSAANSPDNPKPLPELSPANLQKITAALPTASASLKKPRKILVFYKCEGFVHGDGIITGNQALQLLGQKTGAWTAEFSNVYTSLDAANLAQYDAIVLNNTTRLKIPTEYKAGFLNFVKQGKGIVGIHSATDNFYDWPEAAAMLGGVFNSHPWGGGGTWAFKLDEPGHLLNQAFGGKNFKLKDEVYQFKDPYTRADRRVLLTLDLSDPATGAAKNMKREDKDFAVAWIKNYGAGRVFFSNLGHAGNVFMEPAVLKFYLDGIQWALGDLDADATPNK